MARRPRAQQLPVPGTERQSNDQIDAAAMEYVTHRDERMAAAEREKAAKKVLRKLIDTHKDELTKRDTGEIVYRFESAEGNTLEVLLKPVDVKLTVRKVDPESSPGSSGDKTPDTDGE